MPRYTLSTADTSSLNKQHSGKGKIVPVLNKVPCHEDDPLLN